MTKDVTKSRLLSGSIYLDHLMRGPRSDGKWPPEGERKGELRRKRRRQCAGG